jgi:hypothetical protein
MELMDLYFRHHGNVRWRKLGKQVVVLHQASGTYYTLNEMGGVLWEAMDGRTPLGDILQTVLEGYAVEEAAARADLTALARDFIEEGLVETGREPMAEGRQSVGRTRNPQPAAKDQPDGNRAV